MDPDDLISPREAATLAGVSERAILQWIEQNKLQSWPKTAGKRVRHRVSSADVLSLMSERKAQPTSYVAQLERRVAELELVIGELQQTHGRPNLGNTVSGASRATHTSTMANTIIGENEMTVQQFAIIHHIPEETVRSGIRDKRIAALRERRLVNGHIHNSWIDEKAHRQAYQLWRNNTDFQACPLCLRFVPGRASGVADSELLP